jgi:hypothetical protein
MKNILAGLLGANDPHIFFHVLIWALVGAVLSLLLHVAQRNPLTPNSTIRFSWRFFLWDNFKRIITTVLLIVVVLRFMPELLGFQLSAFTAFLAGFANDKLAQMLKNKGILGGAGTTEK